MATNSENYIGVAMGLDVTNLKAGLQEANRQIQLANSEFKAASSGMDDWTKSTEGITAKVKQLDSVLQMQKSKLAGLTAEYDKVVKSQGENSEAARKLKVQINNQQAVVNKTEQEFNNYSETLKEAKAGNIDLEKVVLRNGKAIKKQGDEAKESGSKLDGLKSVAGGVAKGLAAIGAAAVAAVGGFLSLAESTREFREDMAKLDSAFSASKLSADSASATYKTLFGAIGESDTAVEAAQQIALLANSEEEAAKWAELATGVVGTFGDALKAETFYEAANETIKLGEATGAFTQMLEGTGASVDEFNAGLAACTTEEEKQAYMLEISNKLLGDAGAAYNETAKDIIEAREAEAELTQAMAELGAIAEPIMTTLKLLAVDLLKAITPFVELIGEGLKGAIEGAAGATDKLAEGLGGVINALVERLMNMLPTILEVILQLIPTIANTLLEALPQLLDVVIDLVTQIINLLAVLAPQIVAKIVEIIPILIENLVAAVPQLLQAAITLLMALVDALPTIIAALIGALPRVIDTIVNAVIEAFPLLLDGAIQLFNALIEALPVIIQALVKNLPRIINTIVNAVVNAVPLLLQGAIQLFNALIDAIPVVIPLIVAEIPSIVTSICGALIDCIPDLIAAGAELIGGLVAGMANPKNWLSGIQAIGEGIVGAFKGIFKIKSPSKVMRDEIGEYLGEGVGVGVLDSIPTVKKQLGKFAGFVQDNLGGIKSGLAINANRSGGGYATAGRGNTVVNAGMTVNYNGTLSRKRLKQLENDNYTAIKMKLKAEGAI